MKEFSLEEYLKNPDREVVTRDGRKVRMLCTDRKDAKPIIALVNGGFCAEPCYAFFPDGKVSSDEDNALDLFFAPTKYEGWVNIYCAHSMSCGLIYQSEEKAKQEIDNRMGGIVMNEKCLLDEVQQKVVEKLSNEIISIIMKQVEFAINNPERFYLKSKIKKFDAWKFRPYDTVLVRDASSRCWKIDLYGCNPNPYEGLISCASGSSPYCIPYNDETEHLLGTTDDCPEYYKWWEE